MVTLPIKRKQNNRQNPYGSKAIRTGFSVADLKKNTDGGFISKEYNVIKQ